MMEIDRQFRLEYEERKKLLERQQVEQVKQMEIASRQPTQKIDVSSLDLETLKLCLRYKRCRICHRLMIRGGFRNSTICSLCRHDPHRDRKEKYEFWVHSSEYKELDSKIPYPIPSLRARGQFGKRSTQTEKERGIKMEETIREIKLPPEIRRRIYRRVMTRYQRYAQKVDPKNWRETWKKNPIGDKFFNEALEWEINQEKYRPSLQKEPSNLRPSRMDFWERITDEKPKSRLEERTELKGDVFFDAVSDFLKYNSLNLKSKEEREKERKNIEKEFQEQLDSNEYYRGE